MVAFCDDKMDYARSRRLSKEREKYLGTRFNILTRLVAMKATATYEFTLLVPR
jgi:hypothetical protein